MSEFAVPRAAVPARLLLTEGESRPGHVFVMERVPQRVGPETPLEMLNREEGFFAFRPTVGDVLFIAKANTVALEVDVSAMGGDAERLSAARTASLEVVLTGGASLTGWARFELPAQHSRLLDYLNATREPFFAVSTDSATHLVNRAHVLYARPVD
ncbi:MAG TPA: hypothetical protein VFK78_10330 [Gemmatimonadales bacterium]|nr:hypothetical protein [Gemmatimonadales bacterium]